MSYAPKGSTGVPLLSVHDRDGSVVTMLPRTAPLLKFVVVPFALTSCSLAITHTRLADRYSTDPSHHHLARRQMVVAHKALAATRSSEATCLAIKSATSVSTA